MPKTTSALNNKVKKIDSVEDRSRAKKNYTLSKINKRTTPTPKSTSALRNEVKKIDSVEDHGRLKKILEIELPYAHSLLPATPNKRHK